MLAGNRNPSLLIRLKQSDPIELDVSLQCHDGELLALTGPSGSGKTTVLRSIAGLHINAQGVVQCGQNLWQNTDQNIFVSPQQRRVGLVFQHYALFPHLNAMENVAVALSHVPRNLRLNKAMEWLQLTNMEGLHDKRPGHLSGGQRQRIALARALAREPSVLLLDEPFSAVDQLTRDKLYRELAQIRTKLDMPMILVTHDMQEVQQLADSLCLIHHGKTLQSEVQTGSIIDYSDTIEAWRLLQTWAARRTDESGQMTLAPPFSEKALTAFHDFLLVYDIAVLRHARAIASERKLPKVDAESMNLAFSADRRPQRPSQRQPRKS